MSYLAAALAIVSVLCVMNLLLLFLVMRRLREHGERLAKLPRYRPMLQRLTAGTKVQEFTAISTTGESRSLAEMTSSRSLVGFFSIGCPACHDQLPGFIKFAKTIPGGTAQVLAVVIGAEKQAMDFAAGLAEVAAVVIESLHGPVATAFSVPALPSFYLVGADGRVEASGMAMEMIAVPAPA